MTTDKGPRGRGRVLPCGVPPTKRPAKPGSRDSGLSTSELAASYYTTPLRYAAVTRGRVLTECRSAIGLGIELPTRHQPTCSETTARLYLQIGHQ